MIYLEYLFWCSLFILLYNYFLYPVALYFLVRVLGIRQQIDADENHTPPVTFVISAYNEAAVLDEKIANAVALDYPRERMEIIVVSDCSTDRTDEIVRTWEKKDDRVRLLRLNERHGKSRGMNRAVEAAGGEIVVFSDANAMYATDAVRELVKYYHDPRVGYVVGKAQYVEDRENPASQSEGAYWKYELFIKELESEFYSVVGGDGAIYCIRKALFRPLKDEDLSDFVSPLQIIAQDYLGIFNPQAVCYEEAAGNFSKEFRRKVRIVNRSWRAFKENIGRFHLIRHFRFLFELVSHKLIRWYSWLLILLIFVSTVLLSVMDGHWIYDVFLWLELLFVTLAITGLVLDRRGIKLLVFLSIPYYYLIMNLSSMLGIYNNFRGIKYVTWDHVRK